MYLESVVSLTVEGHLTDAKLRASTPVLPFGGRLRAEVVFALVW